jgi:hypothetical protein
MDIQSVGRLLYEISAVNQVCLERDNCKVHHDVGDLPRMSRCAITSPFLMTTAIIIIDVHI